jgi:KDO2-lipid IV(A) lauroyltransferase
MRAANLPDPDRTADGMYGSLGVSLVEFLWLGGRSRRGGRGDVDSVARFDGDSEAIIARAKQVGRGVILAAAHTGNWELGACLLAGRERVVVLSKRLSVGVFDAFAKRTRAAYGVQLAEGEGTLGAALQVLSAGGLVTMLIDQVPESRAHGVPVRFLGQDALASRAPAALAWRTGSPMLVVATRRTDAGTHVLAVLGSLEPPEGAPRAWVDDATRAATRLLERFVLAHPSDWLWLHRRWREPASCLSPARPLHARTSCRIPWSSPAVLSPAGSSSGPESTRTSN